MFELSTEEFHMLFGMFCFVFFQLISSIGEFFLEKARYYRLKNKELKSKKESDAP